VARLNVLITAASRRVALVQAFQRALRRPGTSGKVLVTDVNPLSPAVHIADRAFRVPYADEPDYLEEIQAVCETNGVGLIIPTIDDELPLFAARRAVFEAAGIRVAISDSHATETCNDKYATSEALRAAGVSAVETWLPETLPAPPELPLFIALREGSRAAALSGRQGIHARSAL
jgi:carbamoyl-phosphate synthase large subunit